MLQTIPAQFDKFAVIMFVASQLNEKMLKECKAYKVTWVWLFNHYKYIVAVKFNMEAWKNDINHQEEKCVTHLYATGCMTTPHLTSADWMAELKSMSLTLKGVSFWLTSMMFCGVIFVWITPTVFRAPSAASSCRDRRRNQICQVLNFVVQMLVCCFHWCIYITAFW